MKKLLAACRSLQDLVNVLSELYAAKIDLYLHQQGFDTTTPAGKARDGMARAKANGTKSGKPIGRPAIHPARRAAIRAAYEAGEVSLRAVAEQFGVAVETVRRCIG